MLQGYLLGSYRHVSFHHLKAGVTEYLLQEKDIAPISQISGSEGMPAQMGMEALNSRLPGKARKDQFHRI